MGPRVLFAAVAFVFAGCFLPNFGSFADFDEEGLFSSVLATYTTGTATLQITRGATAETIVLDRLGRGSQTASLMGSSVTWRNDQGWILAVNAYDYGGGLGPFAPRPSEAAQDDSYSGDVSIELIADHEFWRADSYGPSGNRCIVDIEEADESAVRGSATCRGLRWTDGTAVPLNPEALLIEGQDPFDAEITFEATP
jgi:hypothetical protein